MNRDQVEGQWRQVAGKLKASWGKATQDLGTRLSGTSKQFLGILQSRYGTLKNRAEKETRMDRASAKTAAENMENGL